MQAAKKRGVTKQERNIHSRNPGQKRRLKDVHLSEAKGNPLAKRTCKCDPKDDNRPEKPLGQNLGPREEASEHAKGTRTGGKEKSEDRSGVEKGG